MKQILYWAVIAVLVILIDSRNDYIQVKTAPVEGGHVPLLYQYPRDSEIPQYVSLGWKTRSGHGPYFECCSGALVQIGQSQVVLTIADCASKVNKHSSMETPAYALFSNGIQVPIRDLVPHKKWKSPFGEGSHQGRTYKNQIAVVFLDLSSENESSLPNALTLPESGQNADGSGEIIGLWVSFVDQTTSVMHKASTVSEQPPDCSDVVNIWDVRIDRSYLCVVVQHEIPRGREYIPIGAPFFIGNTLHGLYIRTGGIGSTGTYRQIYTKMEFYKGWIENVLKSKSSCCLGLACFSSGE